MKIYFADSVFWKDLDKEFQNTYEQKVIEAYKEASELLPDVSDHVNFFVQPRTYDLIDETEDSGYTVNSELILLAFHPKSKADKKILLDHIRPTVFHELNHAARYNQGIWHETLLEQAIMEGLATVFERDYAHVDPLWGKYDKAEAELWFREISEMKGGFKWDEYMYKHSDGRQWIGYKTGTYIVDEAIKYSGKSVIDLTKMQCSEILKLAKLV